MRKTVNILLCSVRGVRQRLGTGVTNIKASTSESSKPVDWIEDATTYNETFSTMVDPYASLPYPTEDIVRLQKAMKLKKMKRSLTDQNVETFMQRKPQNLNFDHIPIEDQVVVLFPGQGSQFVGMGNKLTKCSNAMALFDEASEVLGYNIKKLCLEGPKTKLDQTIYCQPAVFVASMAAWEKAKSEYDTLRDQVTHTAGFSIGEYNSLVLAKVLSFKDALHIIKIRAEAMHECSQKIASGMLTVRVSAASKLKEAMADARRFAQEQNELPICEIANYLFCGVRVVGASETCMNFLCENQERYAFRVIKRLAVSGAFHTRLMDEAVNSLKKAFTNVKMSKPVINVYSNFTGRLHENSNSKIRSALFQQVCNPVKWEQIQQILFRLHQNYKFPTYMEIGPGKQLGVMFYHISKKAFKFYKNYPC